ncbi:Pectin lyase-like superfamily protein [Zea mays]|uniref:Pectin lyase-like superfamily protein n=1 Tax=Zea mays TaxID=4577 RepID=A0A1D6H451_MAIZE|nr:Pectin lyase-like superfamily protein [Zea mays]
MAFISNIAVKAAAVAALLLVAAVSPAARAAAVAVAGGAPSVPAGPLDIAQLGAKGDGKSDSTPMILKAWKNACEATGVQKIVIPPGNYLTGGLELKGPCKSSIIIRLDGNLLGTGDLSAYQRNWIEIENVENLSINGHGTIDGQGALVWSKNQCQHSYNCKILPNSLVLDFVTNVQIRGITLLNSKFFHLNIFECKNVLIDKVTVKAPGDSPNTDGIHIGDSSNVTISSTTIGVGDEKDVEDVQVTGCTIAGTTNGLRIKSYEDSKSSLKASKFLYEGITMDNVSYPIIIDQKYCPNNICVKSGASKVAVNDVVFKNIHGTSNTPEAITLNCANNLPCQGVQLVNVDIKYNGSGNKTMAVCKNAIGKSIGLAKELACI